jgi:hypothetical protein
MGGDGQSPRNLVAAQEPDARRVGLNWVAQTPKALWWE